MNALAQVVARDIATLSAGDIGFGIAPRINAAGRLEDMAAGIECLLCDEPVRALELATALDAINRERRALQQQTTDEAKAVLASISPAAGDPPVALCLHDPQWHAGVVGLVASKLAQRAHRPAVVFAPAQPGGANCAAPRVRFPACTSATCSRRWTRRTRPGRTLRRPCDGRGLTLAASNLPAFEAALRETVAAMLDPAVLQAELWTDGELARRMTSIAPPPTCCATAGHGDRAGPSRCSTERSTCSPGA